MDDTELFVRLYLEWWPIVRASAEPLLESSADAEDAAQSVFMRLWTKRSWRLIRSPGSFFRKAGRSEAVTMPRRRRSRGRIRSVSLDELPSLVLESRGLRPDQDVLRAESRRLFERAVASLSSRCRHVCRLFFFDELERREIAERLGVTIKAVEKQLARGRKHLREMFDSGDLPVSFSEDGGGRGFLASVRVRDACSVQVRVRWCCAA
jgi:RNA polymerase sigma-70 factor (ECF subfamily)